MDKEMTLIKLIASLTKTGAVTVLGSLAMNCINKKDFGNLIKFTGISSASLDVIAHITYVENHKPLIIKLAEQIIKLLEKMF